MNLKDWKDSNEYSHYQSLIKQDKENRQKIVSLSKEVKKLKLKLVNGDESENEKALHKHIVSNPVNCVS